MRMLSDRELAEIAAGEDNPGALMRRTLRRGKGRGMATKKTCVVKFSKGITISKNYQSVKYDVGLEVPLELAADLSDFPQAVAKLKKLCNAELRKLKEATEPPKPTDFLDLDD